MPDAIIENPIINSPYEEPKRHFKFEREGITNAIVEGRRKSLYFVPIARTKARNKNQLNFDTEWTLDRIKENTFINQVRERIKRWREGGYQGITPITKRLLGYWTNPEREKKLFFCQLEALETAIYLNEVAERNQDHWMLNQLRAYNDEANPGLFRIAFKMATGSGKTVVMAMLVAYHALNKAEKPTDARFGDAFLFITPGITIRDRLRVLLPSDDHNYYRERDLVPIDLMDALAKARIEIVNYQALKLREKVISGSRSGKLADALIEEVARKESPAAMVNRVCKSLKGKRNLIIINDEAHHCYRRKVDAEDEALTSDEKNEAEQNNEEARVWISGIEAIKEKMGVKVIYDLSATPFFLRGSGYPEGTLFPWVVSDFSLIDAIESGIVKIPRVPVADNRNPAMPDFRNLWFAIKDDLPKRGRKTGAYDTNVLPPTLESAIRSLYADYEKTFRQWEEDNRHRPDDQKSPAPVMIVVCNNTSVSKMVYEFISGYEITVGEGEAARTIIKPGALEIFRNEDGERWLSRPNTLLIDSQQLESGDDIDEAFKKTFAKEIERFKQEYLRRFRGRSEEHITDADILREVMNTVGKKGRLGESIKCVVSVSMLTEGWDVNTVTHILGIRAFSTQLLCEQVVGRALRRMSYELNAEGFFEPEYAEVYGVPFSFIPAGKPSTSIQPPKLVTRIRALEERAQYEITFPRLVGYRLDIRDPMLSAEFTDEDTLTLSTEEVPTVTETEPILGAKNRQELFDNLKRFRLQELAYRIAQRVLHHHLLDPEGNPKPWHFPALARIAKTFIETKVVCKDDAFVQLLALDAFCHRAAEKIYHAIARQLERAPQKQRERLLPLLRPYDYIGSTRYIDFDTTKNVIEAQKSHVAYIVADTDSWEQKVAQAFEELPEVLAYIKNQGLEFVIPYTMDGKEHAYYPDFIAKMKTPSGKTLNVIVEVTGKKDPAKEAKVETAKTLWIPAVNNLGKFGEWAFLEIRDAFEAKRLIRAFLLER